MTRRHNNVRTLGPPTKVHCDECESSSVTLALNVNLFLHWRYQLYLIQDSCTVGKPNSYIHIVDSSDHIKHDLRHVAVPARWPLWLRVFVDFLSRARTISPYISVVASEVIVSNHCYIWRYLTCALEEASVTNKDKINPYKWRKLKEASRHTSPPPALHYIYIYTYIF